MQLGLLTSLNKGSETYSRCLQIECHSKIEMVADMNYLYSKGKVCPVTKCNAVKEYRRIGDKAPLLIFVLGEVQC